MASGTSAAVPASPAEAGGTAPVAAAIFAIRTVAVIGAGDQGRAFALRCARAGFRTILEDVMPARLRRAREELGALDSHSSSHSIASPAEHSPQLTFALTVEDAVRDADLAIDFVPDELESKLEIFSLIDRMAPPKTILCTPTTALSISDLASCTYRADRCVALRAVSGELFAGPLLLVAGLKVNEALTGVVQHWLETLGCSVTAGNDLKAV